MAAKATSTCKVTLYRSPSLELERLAKVTASTLRAAKTAIEASRALRIAWFAITKLARERGLRLYVALCRVEGREERHVWYHAKARPARLLCGRDAASWRFGDYEGVTCVECALELGRLLGDLDARRPAAARSENVCEDRA